jgi:hypothetical protein
VVDSSHLARACSCVKSLTNKIPDEREEHASKNGKTGDGGSVSSSIRVHPWLILLI